METADFLLAIAFAILVFSFRPLLRALRNPSPGGAVLITSMSFLAGASLLVAREGTTYEVEILRICCVFLPFFLFGYFGSAKFLGLMLQIPAGELQRIGEDRTTETKYWVFFLVVLSLVLAAVYVSGTDRILAGLYSFIFLGDTGVSIMELRLGFSTGEEGYSAPGYIKQFRDILLPLSAFFVLFAVRRSDARMLLTFAVIVPVVALLMISSGERGPVVLFLLGVTYSALLSVRVGIASQRAILVPLLITFAVGAAAFSALTSTYTNRNYEDSSVGGIFLDRIVTTVPAENGASYYIWAGGGAYIGEGWLSELGSILPGKRVVLSNVLHEELGGGDKGNSVLGMWADVFFNFGWAFGIVASFFIGVFFAFYGHWVNSQYLRSPATAVCGLWISLTMLNVYSPFGFVLYGPFILTAILFGLSRWARIRTESNRVLDAAATDA